MTLIVHSFLKNPLKNNNYAVIDDVSNEAVLVDCSSPDDEIVRWVKKQGAQIKYILLTHAHFDHVLGVNSHHDKFGLDAYLYEKDLPLLAKLNEYTRFLGMKDSDIPQVHSFDLTTDFCVGQYPIEVIATPGHTNGSVCYYVDNKLFAGDTLFHGTYGRTDLPEGDEDAMQKSLQLLFHKLPDETIVYPGHGATTTIGHERWLYK